MTLVHDTYTVGTSATLIATIPAKNPTIMVTITNDDNSSVFIGDATVAASGADKGITIVKNTSYNLALNAGDKLYAISAAGTSAYAVSVVYSKVIG
jgi:hypothetical protein